MSENDPASTNVPATRDVIRSIGKAFKRRTAQLAQERARLCLVAISRTHVACGTADTVSQHSCG